MRGYSRCSISFIWARDLCMGSWGIK